MDTCWAQLLAGFMYREVALITEGDCTTVHMRFGLQDSVLLRSSTLLRVSFIESSSRRLFTCRLQGHCDINPDPPGAANIARHLRKLI